MKSFSRKCERSIYGSIDDEWRNTPPTKSELASLDDAVGGTRLSEGTVHRQSASDVAFERGDNERGLGVLVSRLHCTHAACGLQAHLLGEEV